MTDPDILAIQRRRRQEGRCVRCGAKAPRAMLCVDCRVDWRYCPRCEVVHTGIKTKRISVYCPPCNAARCLARRTQRREAYRQARRTQKERLFPVVIEQLRRGKTAAAVAAALGIQQRYVYKLIAYAHKTGRWPVKMKTPNYRRREAA